MPLVKLINLELDHPTVTQGLLRFDHALAAARQEGIAILKVIHGYGSSGVGGQLRFELWQVLDRCKRNGQILDFIPGEEFRVSNEGTWALLRNFPEMKRDRDLGRQNKGVTLVVLQTQRTARTR